MNTVVIGSLNTDLIATGLRRFPTPGELVVGKELVIGAGGKSRNIADMIAHLSGPDTVAMVGRTVSDPYGLWKPPIDALKQSGVNTDYVVVTDYELSKKLPGIALIPVDEQGNNQIIVLPGASADFSIADLDNAIPLFEQVGANKGAFILTLECPLDTALHGIKLANKYGLKVMFDPGGIQSDNILEKFADTTIFLIKPNEHEAKVLTGIEVNDLGSAGQAAAKLYEHGIKNVLITAGANGAYLFSKNSQIHIPVPNDIGGNDRDETGCGDQTMAALCAYIELGKSLEEAARLSIRAGTLQFYRHGIKPLSVEDV